MKHRSTRTPPTTRPAIWLAVCLALPSWTAFLLPVHAAEKDAKKPADAPTQPSGAQSSGTQPSAKLTSAERLSLEEAQIQERFKKFEETLLKMAELTAANDPKRAALLRKAVAQSKEQLIALQLERVVDVLKRDQLGTALTDQQAVEQDMQKLLQLLLTEQRSEKLKDERERLKEQIRKLKEIINRQIQVQAETEGKGDAAELAKRQEKLAQDTGKLGSEMQAAADPNAKPGDAGKSKPDGAKPKEDGKPNDGKPGESKKNDSKQKDAKPGESKPSDGKPSDSKPADGKPNDSKPGEGDKPSKPGAKPMPGKDQPPMPGQSGEADDDSAPPPPANETPGRKRIAAAEQKMEDARKKLEKAQREGAGKDQEEAVRELEQAKAELEEILRQLRDEEVERVLAQLEARFRKMLEMQQEVYEGTRRVDRVPVANRGRSDEIEAGRLSRKESMIVVEADKALGLLHDEGSAVAFPEAVEQLREDMEQVVARLAQAKVDQQTQGLEEDIIAGLEEMIASLQKAQRDKEKQKDQQAAGGGEPGEPPLVDKISELKMIRSLQMRVNTRTKRYSRLVEGDVGQSETPDLLDALKRLAEREDRIYRATRDIVIGKNE